MMRCVATFSAVVCATVLSIAPALSADISGDYLETRTCDIYTGPCFANAEISMAGKEAIMAWNIEKGSVDGVDLSGLNVVVAVRAAGTLGFGGGLVFNAEPIRSVVFVDQRATLEQRAALVSMVQEHGGPAIGEIQDVIAATIEMEIDHIDMVAQLNAGNSIELITRKLGESDCVCTNEIVFYPPLARVDNAAPAYTVSGRCSARGLGGTWDNPGTRSAFLATFSY